MPKHGGTPSWRDKYVAPAAISSPGVARGRFVGGQQSGLAGCKPPPLFTRGASSSSSQGRRKGEPWGASPRPSAPTYLPTWVVFIWVLVAVLVWVPQLLVLGVGSGVVGHLVLLGVGARHSLLRACGVLLIGLPLCPSRVSGGPAAPLAEGRWALVPWVLLCCVPLWCGGARILVCCARVWGACWSRLWRCVLCARAGVCAVC